MGAGTLGRALLGRFEGLVSPKVLPDDERLAHARAIAALVAAGLCAALVSPFAGLAELGIPSVVAPTVAASLCLALAGLLASSGRLDLVLGLGAATFALFLTWLAALGGGLASPLLLLLLVAPVEAAIAGRRALAGLASGIACLALGAVALAQWLGFAGGAGYAFDEGVVVAFGILYAALQTLRLARARARGRAAREMQSMEARLVENALQDAVLRFSPEGRLLSASKAADALFAGRGAALDAATIFQAIHVTDRVRYLKAFGDIRGGAAAVAVDVRAQSHGPAAAGFCEIALKLIAVRDAEGRLLSTLAIARDVTAERMRTGALSQALSEAKKSSDAKSQFLAAVSHELRTPLNAIIGFSDVLDQEFFGGFENPRQKEYVGLIRQSGEHLLSVVNGLLDISKIEAGRYELTLEPFRIGPALASAAEVLRPEAERKGLRLELRPVSVDAEIVADRRACHQILLNLLSNAIKFTESGTITLSAEIGAGTLALSVADTGIGIAGGEIARLGEPFTQLSSGIARRYQGTGLGLSLVKGLSELHLGSMEIASELGRGTTVTVRIPLDCADRIADQQTTREKIVALANARKKTHPHQEDERQARRTA